MIPSRFLFGDVWGFRLSANTAVSHRKLWSKKSGTTIVVEFWIWSVTFQIVGGASFWAETSWCCWWYIYIWILYAYINIHIHKMKFLHWNGYFSQIALLCFTSLPSQRLSLQRWALVLFAKGAPVQRWSVQEVQLHHCIATAVARQRLFATWKKVGGF